MNFILLYVASGILVLWGIAHIVPTAAVVKGFGELSADNRHIITMEWVAEGLALCFIGVLVFLVTLLAGPGEAASSIVYRACAAMLIVMAVWTALTGAKTSIIPIKICPIVKSLCAIMLLAASLL
jgi:hypothetical protein